MASHESVHTVFSFLSPCLSRPSCSLSPPNHFNILCLLPCLLHFMCLGFGIHQSHCSSKPFPSFSLSFHLFFVYKADSSIPPPPPPFLLFLFRRLQGSEGSNHMRCDGELLRLKLDVSKNLFVGFQTSSHFNWCVCRLLA